MTSHNKWEPMAEMGGAPLGWDDQNNRMAGTFGNHSQWFYTFLFAVVLIAVILGAGWIIYQAIAIAPAYLDAVATATALAQ